MDQKENWERQSLKAGGSSTLRRRLFHRLNKQMNPLVAFADLPHSTMALSVSAREVSTRSEIATKEKRDKHLQNNCGRIPKRRLGLKRRKEASRHGFSGTKKRPFG